MFEAILFDFDGTLVDFVDVDIQSLKHLHSLTASPVCFDAFLTTAVDEIMRFHSLVAQGEIDPLLLHEFRLKNTFAEHKIFRKNSYIDDYKNALLKTCRSFDVIVIAGEIGIYKPDPSIFIDSLKRVGVVPAKSLYVGDSIVYDMVGKIRMENTTENCNLPCIRTVFRVGMDDPRPSPLQRSSYN